MKRGFREDTFRGISLGLILGLFYGSLRAFFFYDTIAYFAWGFKEISFQENILLKFYVICLYLLFGAFMGIILQNLYLWGCSLFRGRERKFSLSFVSSLLSFYSFINIFVYVNFYKFLSYWGQKIYFGNIAVRKAMVTPVVILTDVLIVIFFTFIGWLMISIFNAIDASRRIQDRATTDALIFSLSLGYFVYFSLLTPINNRLSYVTSPESVLGNILLVAACIALFVVADLFGRKVLKACHRQGRTVLQSFSGPLTRTAACSAIVLALLGVFHCACVMESPGIKYLIYVKAPKEITYFLFYLNKALDFDRDGYSWVSPIKDPQPFNAAVHPMAVDIPFNGIDEDGVGGDMMDMDLDGHDARWGIAYESPHPHSTAGWGRVDPPFRGRAMIWRRRSFGSGILPPVPAPVSPQNSLHLFCPSAGPGRDPETHGGRGGKERTEAPWHWRLHPNR